MPDPNRLALIADLANEDPVFALLLHEQAEDDAQNIDLSLEIIIRHYAGALDYFEIRNTERLLTRSREGRILARDTRRHLDYLKTLPLYEVQAVALSDADVSETARIWLVVVGEHVESTLQLFQTGDASREIDSVLDFAAAAETVSTSISIWSTVRALGDRGRKESRAMASSLRSFSIHMRNALRRISPSYSRGAAEQSLSFHGALDIECIVKQCYIDALGELICEIDFFENGSASSALDDRHARLHLATSGAYLPVAATVIYGGKALWIVPELGEMIGIEDAPLNSQFIAVSVSQKSQIAPGVTLGPSVRIVTNEEFGEWVASAEPGATSSIDGVTLFASILTEDGQEMDVQPAAIVVGELTLIDESLTVSITLHAVTRAAYPEHDLVLDLSVGPHHWQRLGAWPIADWVETERWLEVPVLGFTVSAPPPVECLRFQLRPQ